MPGPRRTQGSWPKKLQQIETKGDAVAQFCDALPRDSRHTWADTCTAVAERAAESARQGEDWQAENAMHTLKSILRSAGRSDIWTNWRKLTEE